MRKRLMTSAAVAITLAVVVAAGFAVLGGGEDDDATRLAGALRLSPADTQRISWTDWSGVRREVGLELDAGSPGPAIEDLLERGFESDLASTSALGSSAVDMQQRLGFSPATLDWELFSQGFSGASLAMRAGSEVDFDFVTASLREAGYEEPAEPTGTWISDPTTDEITSQLTPELLLVAVDAERRLIFASDTDAGIRAALAAGDAAESTVLSDAVVEALGDPLSAALYTGDQVCSALALSGGNPSDVETGEALIEAAGEVDPIIGFAMGVDADGDVRVVMSFEDEERARTNAETRAVLASGPAPGQGGDFAERFTLESATATGTVVVLDLEPAPGAYVLSDLSNGPLLFATC